jgi:murein DD-endopeptidase MepM/ murein hydrolase activator NlpD
MAQSLAWEGDWPVTQLYGERPSYYGQWGLAGHNGVDIACPPGTLLRALYDGECLWNGDDPGGYGLYVVYATPWGGSVLYAHLSDRGGHPLGEPARAGDPLCYSGNTGNSSGPHLHLGIRPDANSRWGAWAGYCDPIRFLVG